MTIRYQHRQPATTTLVILAVVLAIDAVIITCILLAASDFAPALMLVPALVAGLLVVMGILFASLTVTIDDRQVKLSFGPGLVRKRIPLEQIAGCRVTTTHWYDGWGIHWTAHGTLYNVSGFKAVAVELANGKRLCIGTDEPEALAEAIRRATRQSSMLAAG